MGGIENGAVLLPQPGQRGDREEPTVAAYPAAPADEAVMLTVVHLAAGARACPRRNGITEVAEAQYVAVHHEVVDIIVRTQNRQYDSAVVQRPVDIEERGESRVATVFEDVPPIFVLLGRVDAEVVGNDVDDQTHTVRSCRRRQPGQPFGTAEVS